MMIESAADLLAAKRQYADLERQLNRLTALPRSSYTSVQDLERHTGAMVQLKEMIEAYERREEE